MNRSVAATSARVAGGALLAFAVLPVALAGTAHAADAPAPAATSYVDEVGIGTAVKIGNPAEVGKQAAASASATPTEAPDESTVTATPSDAVVIETESRQAGSPEATDVAVLGTKIGADGDTLAETGPGTLTVQALVALALITLGAALRGGPQLAVAVRRTAGRRH